MTALSCRISGEVTMYKLTFFVPLNCKEEVKSAVFAPGAGRIGDYEHCCFETVGRGQFRALDGAQPAIGALNELTYVDEVKVELVVSDELITDAVRALKKSHPYEEPAYDVFKCIDIEP